MSREKPGYSHVAMTCQICRVCGCKVEGKEILLSKTLSPVFKDGEKVPTGWTLCEEHQRLADNGYIALVGVDESKSDKRDGVIQLSGAYRTGDVMHIRRTVWPNVFDKPFPENLDMCFVDPAVITRLKEMM